MKQQEFLKKLQDIIAPYLENPCEIGMESNLFKDLTINSVDFVHIFAEVEETFQCSVDDGRILEICSVKDLIQNLMEASGHIK